MRRRKISVSSRAETSRLRTSSTCRAAPAKARSVASIGPSMLRRSRELASASKPHTRSMRSFVDGLCSHAGRGACTDAERRAALWLHDELRARGHHAWVETLWVRPLRALALALAALLAVAGRLLATAVPLPGLIVS